MRGEFIRGDGLVIPNNITLAGSEAFLRSAFRNEAFTPHFGLVNGFPTRGGQIPDLLEPTIGTGGYARQVGARSTGGWPTVGTLGSEIYVESATFTFPATGNYSRTVNRVMMAPTLSGLTGGYLALSSAFPELQITAATPLGTRQFKYRIYWG